VLSSASVVGIIGFMPAGMNPWLEIPRLEDFDFKEL
jgi:hypothetical protein